MWRWIGFSSRRFPRRNSRRVSFLFVFSVRFRPLGLAGLCSVRLGRISVRKVLVDFRICTDPSSLARIYTTMCAANQLCKSLWNISFIFDTMLRIHSDLIRLFAHTVITWLISRGRLELWRWRKAPLSLENTIHQVFRWRSERMTRTFYSELSSSEQTNSEYGLKHIYWIHYCLFPAEKPVTNRWSIILNHIHA